MMDWARIEKALVAWLQGVMGATVRLSDQRAPRPPYPYATIRIDGPRVVGMDETRRGTGDDVEVRGQREITVSINVYGKGVEGRTLADKAQSSLGLHGTRAALYAAGLSVVEVGPVQNLTFLQDTDFIERMQMDVRMALASSTTERVGFIATADVAGEIDGD